MQKVVKDILTHTRKKKHDTPKIAKAEAEQLAAAIDVSDFESLKKLILLREGAEIRAIFKKLQKAVLENGEPFFDVWMYESNEEI